MIYGKYAKENRQIIISILGEMRKRRVDLERGIIGCRGTDSSSSSNGGNISSSTDTCTYRSLKAIKFKTPIDNDD